LIYSNNDFRSQLLRHLISNLFAIEIDPVMDCFID